MTSAIDLERKTENAFASRLKQQPSLARMRMRRNSEDSPKVNGDFVIAAKRGEGDPPFSGIYNVTVEIMLTMRHRKTVDTLPQFLAVCAAVEDVLGITTIDMVAGVPVQRIASQLSSCAPDFCCYQLAVTGKDDTPEDNKHKCVWALTVIAMSQSYANAVKLQTN